jgi:glyoxylase-like metal-dependent hydrolase (beta-lactamase superfamily II)
VITPIPLGFDTSYVLQSDGVIVIDAGAPSMGKQFISGLTRAGIEASKVQLIVLTHGHWDHVGSASELKELTGARLADVWQTSLHNPDFAEYANLCGALGIRVTHSRELDDALRRGLDHDGPSLVEIMTDSELV